MTSNLKPSEIQSLIRLGLFILGMGIGIPVMMNVVKGVTEPEQRPLPKDFRFESKPMPDMNKMPPISPNNLPSSR
jgi:hypothetical protein